MLQIMGVASAQYWPHEEKEAPLPPPKRSKRGRPPKVRRRGSDEPPAGSRKKVKGAKRINACKLCVNTGHNKRTCKNTLKQTTQTPTAATSSAHQDTSPQGKKERPPKKNRDENDTKKKTESEPTKEPEPPEDSHIDSLLDQPPETPILTTANTLESRPRGLQQYDVLNSRAFDQILNEIRAEISSERRNHYAFVDCLLYESSLLPDRTDTVMGWLKKMRLFSHKYVFIPALCRNHYFLIILCNLSDKKKMCILILDFLRYENARVNESEVRSFVHKLFKHAKPAEEREAKTISVHIPKIPTQPGGTQCGYYVLYYIHLFVSRHKCSGPI